MSVATIVLSSSLVLMGVTWVYPTVSQGAKGVAASIVEQAEEDRARDKSFTAKRVVNCYVTNCGERQE